MATAARRTLRTYRRWIARGYDRAAAGNLTALELGIRPAPDAPWSPEGIEKLLSVRFQVRRGWLAGDTMCDTEPWAGLWT